PCARNCFFNWPRGTPRPGTSPGPWNWPTTWPIWISPTGISASCWTNGKPSCKKLRRAHDPRPCSRRPQSSIIPFPKTRPRFIGPPGLGEAMPHTSSAKKRLRQTEKQRLYNRAVKKAIKIQLKKVMALAKEGSFDQLKKEYNQAAMKLDKAAAKRVVHPNMAARKKSQLAKLVNAKAGSSSGGPSKK